ncbi:MAG: hypothetical protein AAFO73_11700, partial [Pseudomonadota bacterium]
MGKAARAASASCFVGFALFVFPAAGLAGAAFPVLALAAGVAGAGETAADEDADFTDPADLPFAEAPLAVFDTRPAAPCLAALPVAEAFAPAALADGAAFFVAALSLDGVVEALLDALVDPPVEKAETPTPPSSFVSST